MKKLVTPFRVGLLVLASAGLLVAFLVFVRHGTLGGDSITVYAIDTSEGGVQKIPVGTEPHGLTIWPQPGRYSLGHTGNMR